MTRRWKGKRARHAYSAGPQSVNNQRPAYRDILPAELWQLAFSFCLPTTLFAVRDTCRLFREIVDRNGGKLLAHAPLLLPRPPPDPRWWLRRVKHRGQARVIRDFFDIKSPWAPRMYGSAVYTNLIFRSGRCDTCNIWTPGPPEWIHSKIYFCSKECKLIFFRTNTIFLQPKFRYLPARSVMPKIDRFIIPWLPIFKLSGTSKGKGTNAVFVRDLVAARDEYRAEVLSAGTREERARRRKALFQFQAYIDMWKRAMHASLARFKSTNVGRLRKIASRRGIPRIRVMRNPTIRRRLRTRGRDFRRMSSSTLTKAGLSGAKCKKRVCDLCGIAVARDWYDWHKRRRHADQIPDCRLNFKTGKAEYRCDLCEDLPIKWFTSDALQSHEYHR
ncbi:hypothetical protein EV714DRAFT_220789 [Schizophyllum commune]